MTLVPASFLDFGRKWVVITGGSSGLGRASAVELSRHDARLVLVGRNGAALDETRRSLDGDWHEVLVLDLCDLSAIGPPIARIAKQVGRIYGLCHAAGGRARSTSSSMRAPGWFGASRMAPLLLP